MKKIFHRDILVPIISLILLSLPFVFTDLDLIISGWVYKNGWPYGSQLPWSFLYKYGTIPGLLLTAAALVVLIGSWIWPKLTPKRRGAALIILTLIIGPGLLVNTFGKGYYGRPRPREIVQFQGTQQFHHLHQPGQPGRGKSFPCGHASVGFLIVAGYFLTRRGRRVWLYTGLGYGALLGTARILQGGHFASDVLWAGGLTFLTASVLHHLVLPQPSSNGAIQPTSKKKKIISAIVLSLLLTMLIGFFMVATPYFKRWKEKILVPNEVKAVLLKIPSVPETVYITHKKQKEAMKVVAELQGFGFPKLKLSGKTQADVKGTTLIASLNYDLKGYVTERVGKVTVFLRHDLALLLDEENLKKDLYIGEKAFQPHYGAIRIISKKGKLHFRAPEGTTVSGPITLVTNGDDLRLSINEIKQPGSDKWKIGSTSGKVYLNVIQETKPDTILKIFSWSRFNNVYFNSTIGTHSGLNLKWDEKKGRSMIFAKGHWIQEGNFVYGPTGMATPHIEMLLVTSKGQLDMRMMQGKGEALVALPTPTPTVKRKSAFYQLNEQATIVPMAKRKKAQRKTIVPKWVEQELIALPYENPDATWGVDQKKLEEKNK